MRKNVTLCMWQKKNRVYCMVCKCIKPTLAKASPKKMDISKHKLHHTRAFDFGLAFVGVRACVCASMCVCRWWILHEVILEIEARCTVMLTFLKKTITKHMGDIFLFTVKHTDAHTQAHTLMIERRRKNWQQSRNSNPICEAISF